MTIQTAVLIETLQALGADRALGLVQHLLDAGPRRRRHRRGRHAGVRHQGRVAEGLLGLHPPHLRLRPQGLEGRRPEHDPGRRRRRHAADAPGPAAPRRTWACSPTRPARKSASSSPPSRPSWPSIRPGTPASRPQIIGVTEETTTGVHRLNEMSGQGQAAVPRHQRQRLGHQEQVRQPVRLPRIAGRRHQARDRRDDRRQGGRAWPATATWARARPRRCARCRRGCGSPRSTRSTPCRPRWKATRS